MKSFFSRFNFKPSGLKMLVESESRCHKIRIIAFAIVMATIAGTYEWFYMNIVMRSGQLQMRALGGMEGYEFVDYVDPKGRDMFKMKNELDVLESKSFRDIKYISSDWISGLDSVGNVAEVQEVGSPTEGWFTQSMRYDAYYVDTSDWQAADYVEEQAKEYSRWKDMHDNVMWYDTAACASATNRIGDVNDAGIRGATSWDYSLASENNNDWTLDIRTEGSMNWAGEDLYKDILKAKIELYEDCDLDCQKRGSGMTIVAILNQTVLGLIGLNALFMFIGTWRYRWRACSVYCTIAMCVFQFIVLIVSATMLFSKYTMTLCATSLTSTAPDFMWSMADDVNINVQLWGAQLILMFCFVCCGFCSAYKADD